MQVLVVQHPPTFAHVLQALQHKGAHGAQSPHPLITLNALSQVQTVDFEQQQKIAQISLVQKMTEVARLAKAVQDSIANPAEVVHLSDLLKIVSQECTHLQAEFRKTFGPHIAAASGAASGATLPSGHANQSTAHMLPSDQNGQVVSGRSGVVGPILDPSAAVFQPNDGNLPGSIAATDPAGIQMLFGAGPMTTQDYEVTLDPNYVTD